PISLDFPIGSVQFAARVDGTPAVNLDTLDIELNYSYDDSCVHYQNGYRDLGDGYNLYIDSYGGPCYGSGITYVTINKYAADYVIYSYYHDEIYGTTYESTYENHFGTFLNVQSQIETRFVISSSAGAFGGDGSTSSLYTYPYDYSWDYVIDY